MQDSKYGNKISVQVRSRCFFIFMLWIFFYIKLELKKVQVKVADGHCNSVKKYWIVKKAITVLWAIFSVQSGPDCTCVETYITLTSVSKIHRWLMPVWHVRAHRGMNFKARKQTDCTIPYQSYPCYFSALFFPMENCQQTVPSAPETPFVLTLDD